ncbi:hypothetical protein BHM03_00018366 [Ensete ventricosum]|nr:hypothetical protein BHM03_00018366 [Ensete ventricosum]
MLWDFGVVAEESARPGPYRVHKHVHVSRCRWRPIGFGLVSREPVPRRSPLLVSPKEDFILTGREIARTLNLISAVTSSVAKSYSESVGTETWHEDMTRHATLMAHDGSSIIMASGRFHLGCRRDYGTGVGPNLTRIST